MRFACGFESEVVFDFALCLQPIVESVTVLTVARLENLVGPGTDEFQKTVASASAGFCRVVHRGSFDLGWLCGQASRQWWLAAVSRVSLTALGRTDWSAFDNCLTLFITPWTRALKISCEKISSFNERAENIFWFAGKTFDRVLSAKRIVASRNLPIS
jgi:hypothetical protein